MVVFMLFSLLRICSHPSSHCSEYLEFSLKYLHLKMLVLLLHFFLLGNSSVSVLWRHDLNAGLGNNTAMNFFLFFNTSKSYLESCQRQAGL